MDYITLNDIALSLAIPIAGIGIYVGSLLTLSGLSNLFSEKIKDQKHLNELLEEECKKLKIDSIPAILKNSKGAASLTSYVDGTHLITLYKGDARSRVRHEVYHYYTKQHQTLLTNQFHEETRAILYESLRIKL